ncbi:MAG: S8 family serine peptidase [Pseudomonas sp.]|uniref:S8 family serine peptidase n=1 Tax=Pseudomonas sp. TaxID=306 RepID=UPI003395BC16
MHLPQANASVARLNTQQLAQLRKDPAVDYIELDPKRYLMAEEVPYGITQVQAPLVSDSNIASRKVCIVDTGYSLGHQDLPSSGITGNDGYGSNDTGNWYEDGNGHGTHVAGTIAALGGNNLGVVGVSPSGNIGLHIVKVFNNAGNWAYGSDLVAAIQQCRDAGSNVISMSLGGAGSSTTERNAMDAAYNAGVLVVAAAGNDGNSALSYPAAYESVISVAAVDSSRNKASFSQYNADVEIAAPGVAVRSTTPNNGYGNKSGTSMATPHASAVYALVWSQHTQCTAPQIRNAVNASAQDRGTAGRDVNYGFGITQAKAASDLITTKGCAGDGGTPPGNGETHPNLAATTGNWIYHSFTVPAGTASLKVKISGGSGDADLYVRSGSKPTTSAFTCRPYKDGNDELCTLANPAAGTWHTGIRAYSSFSGVTLNWEY